jgi:hypothetical protein
MLTARSRFYLRTAASVILLGLLASKVHWSVLLTAWEHLNPMRLLAASAVAPLMIGMLALRWRVFLRQQSIAIPGRKVLGLAWAGQFFNSVLPGSTGGDIVKIYQVCRMFPEKKAAAAASVIIDRVTALIALTVLAAGSFLYGRALPDLHLRSLPGSPAAWVAGGVAVAGLIVFGCVKLIGSPHWLARIRQIVAALRTSFTFNRAFVLGLANAFAVHLLNIAVFFGFARALGISITYLQALSFYPIILFLLLIPVTVNGHGLREALFLFYFTQLHITLKATVGGGSLDTVFSLSLLMVANDLLWTLPGGLWYLLALGKPPKSGAGVD